MPGVMAGMQDQEHPTAEKGHWYLYSAGAGLWTASPWVPQELCLHPQTL